MVSLNCVPTPQIWLRTTSLKTYVIVEINNFVKRIQANQLKLDDKRVQQPIRDILINEIYTKKDLFYREEKTCEIILNFYCVYNEIMRKKCVNIFSCTNRKQIDKNLFGK